MTTPRPHKTTADYFAGIPRYREPFPVGYRGHTYAEQMDARAGRNDREGERTMSFDYTIEPHADADRVTVRTFDRGTARLVRTRHIHREDADPESVGMSYRLAAAWFGNFPEPTEDYVEAWKKANA